MRRAALALALVALATTACVGSAELQSYSKARTGSIERIEAGFDLVRAPAEMAITMLPEPGASRGRALLATADAALAIVRDSRSPAARLKALRQLLRAAAILATIKHN